MAVFLTRSLLSLSLNASSAKIAAFDQVASHSIYLPPPEDMTARKGRQIKSVTLALYKANKKHRLGQRNKFRFVMLIPGYSTGHGRTTVARSHIK